MSMFNKSSEYKRVYAPKENAHFTNEITNEIAEYKRVYAPKEKANTCCWLCSKSVDGCSWSRDGQPVKGWKAVRRVYGRSEESTDYTYKIYFCPEFKEGDAAKGRKLNGAGTIKLWETVAAGIGEEYRQAVAEVVRAQDELMSEECTVQRRNHLLSKINHGKGIMAMYSGVLGGDNCLILQEQAIEELDSDKRKEADKCPE